MTLLLSFLISFGAKYAGEFLLLPVGGRAQGLGSAYVTLAEVAEAPFWNPACIVRGKGKEIFLFHSPGFGGIVNYNAISFAISGETEGIGIALRQIRIPDMIFTDDTIPLDTLDVDDWIFYFTYGRNAIYPNLSLGVTLMAIYRNFREGTAYGIGIDGGLLYDLPPFSFGLSIQNLTTTVLFWSTNTREIIPPLLRTGVSYKIPIERFDGTLVIAAGLDTDLEGKITKLDVLKSDPYIGLEYVYRERFAVRVGLDRGDPSFGVGLKIGSFRIDYGQSQHELGVNTRISGSVRF